MRLVRILVVSVLAAGGLMAVATVTAGSAAAATAAGGYVAVAPARLLDTRTGTGAPKHAVAAMGTVALSITGQAGVPAGAAAVALNVTTVSPTAAGFVTVWGDGVRPLASNLNYGRNQTVANAVITPIGADGKVRLFNSSIGTTQLVADISGYYTAGSPTNPGALKPLAPTRLLDTRTGNGAPVHTVGAGATLKLQVSGRATIPAGAAAAVLNVTAVAPSAVSFVTVWGGGARPTTSNLNVVPGQDVPNLVITPLAADGTVSLYNAKGTIDLVADVFGYFLPGSPVDDGTLKAIAPARLLDTRIDSAFPSTGVRAFGTATLPVRGVGGVPTSGVAAVVVNVTEVSSTAAGFVSVYASGGAQPLASNLNHLPAHTVPNLVIAPVSADGKIALYAGSAGTTHLIVDVFGYILGNPQPTWSAAQLPDSATADPSRNIQYYDVACPVAGFCAAIGFYNVAGASYSRSMIATLSAGAWSQLDVPVPANASGSTAILQSVSCAAAGRCVAVGYYQDKAGNIEGLIETLSEGSWTASIAPTPADATLNQAVLNSVTCSSSATCVAVGSYTIDDVTVPGLLLTLSGTTWTAARAPLPTGSTALLEYLYEVSCKATTCAAVGRYGNTGDQHLGPLILTRTGSTWAAITAPPGGEYTDTTGKVACPAAGACVTVGAYHVVDHIDSVGFADTLSGATWTGVSVDHDNNNDQVGALYGLSCPSITFCAATGNYSETGAGVVATGYGSTWAARALTYPVDNVSDGQLYGISCVANNSCTGVGYYYTANKRYRALVAALSGSTWTASPGANPSLAPSDDNQLIAVSCVPGGSFCAAVGSTIDRSDKEHGLLETYPDS